jgi:hypothetical protein
MGIIGNRRVSDLSFELTMFYEMSSVPNKLLRQRQRGTSRSGL